MPFPWVAAAAIAAPVLNTIGNYIGAGQQADHNLELAKYQNAYNRRMVMRQRVYDLPKNQRKRLEDAGLNPNLMYDSGGVAQSGMTMQRSADIRPADYQGILANIGTQMAQTRLMMSQADLTDQKVEESGIKQSLMKAQTAVVEANPYLDKAYMDAFVTSMQTTADLKKQQLGFQEIQNFKSVEKITKEIDLLAQRFKLAEQDSKIKAEIFKSQEFQNYINEMKRRWLEDGEISGDLVRFGALMLMERLK